MQGESSEKFLKKTIRGKICRVIIGWISKTIPRAIAEGAALRTCINSQNIFCTKF